MRALEPATETLSTQWSLISRVRQDSPEAHEALERLAERYRDPIRDYIAALGHAAHCEDLTQEFFSRKFLRESFFQSVQRGSGSFRVFLKLCVKRFLIDHHRRRRAPGEGPDAVSLDAPSEPDLASAEYVSPAPSADRILDRRWAGSLIGRARERLQSEFSRAGKEELGRAFFGELDQDPEVPGHREIAARLGMSVGAVTTSFYRFRLRLQHLIGEELAATVESPDDVEAERQHLRAAFTTPEPPGFPPTFA